MSGDAVKRALEAGAMTMCCDNWDECSADEKASLIGYAANTVAAFLRALPDVYRLIGQSVEDFRASNEALAAAVTQAAQEGSGDG